MKQNVAVIPHSWCITDWPSSVFPGNASSGGFVVRAHRDELLHAGAIARVGKRIVVLGARYDKWLQTKSADVPGYQIAPNK